MPNNSFTFDSNQKLNINQGAFAPVAASTVSLAASNVTGNVLLVGTGTHVRIFNSGSVPVFVKLGTSNAVTASATADYPIGPGTIEVIYLGSNTYVAGITATSTATIYFTPGEGL